VREEPKGAQSKKLRDAARCPRAWIFHRHHTTGRVDREGQEGKKASLQHTKQTDQMREEKTRVRG